uniref:ATP-grasp domain-containing protein n=1 Tax=Panagrolaimus sp. PS1159 TaxID=55785 RepID=A0AC35G4X8_9BILA
MTETAEILSQISPLSSKRLTVILLKWKYPFYTHLPDFQKPKDVGLIGIFAEQIREKLFEGYEKYFDAIFWFKPDYTESNRVYVDTNSVEIPEVEEILAKILKVLPKEKICLLETEEFMIEPICKLREKYSIPGPRSHELEYLRDKSVLKKIAEEKGIPTMKFAIFDSKNVQSAENEVKKIIKRIKTFPIFRKPISGCGSGGGGRINDESELHQFIKDEINKKEKSIYLMEECVKGKDVAEFWVSCVLLENGNCKPFLNIVCKRGMTNSEHLKTGYPMPFNGFSLEQCEEEFPKLADFAIDVAKKLNPPAPHIFCVQGFQLKPNTSEYLLTEVGYRINGARGARVSYYGAGISQETALLMCHLDPKYPVKQDLNRPKFHRRYLWYPFIKGTLQSKMGIPSDSPITSKIGYDWLIEEGTKMEAAESFGDFMVFLTIDNNNEKDVDKDLLWLEKNYRPDVV